MNVLKDLWYLNNSNFIESIKSILGSLDEVKKLIKEKENSEFKYAGPNSKTDLPAAQKSGKYMHQVIVILKQFWKMIWLDYLI